MKDCDKNWLMDQIENFCTEPQFSNFAIRKGRCDLEIVITVSRKDETFFTENVLDGLKNDLSIKTGFAAPVIYLEGNEPEWLAKGWYI